MPKMKKMKKLSVSAALLLSSSTIVTVPLNTQADSNNLPLFPYASTQILLSDDRHTHWSYASLTGPEYWGELHDDYKACSDGEEQSPVALHNDDSTDERKWSFDLDYKETTFYVENNGHTIQANVGVGSSNKLIINGTDYELAQFHFHSPSEHTLDGHQYEMEVHLVHIDEDENLAVLGVLVEEGDKNETLEEMWEVIPEETSEADQAVSLNPSALVPSNLSTFQYDGSLTTPSCSENVKWSVSDASITMSKEQLQTFQDLYPDNYRPIQDLGDREVGFHY